MNIFPAIDLYQGCVVRLFQGDYKQMTVYSREPVKTALEFKALGASYLHLVDLEGAKGGETPNIDKVADIVCRTSMFIEIGGGIRTMETVKKYFNIGVDRVILGTAAVTNEDFLKEAVEAYGEKIAVGVDCRDDMVAIKGWTEDSGLTCDQMCQRMEAIGVRTLICTDISRDGAMRGANRALYKELSLKYDMNIVASGGVSSIEDVKELAALSLYGVIIGKAYYTGAIDIREAIEVAK
ncbi:MAG: 1-(5-phosphoribosyl)-5-[(5-phosphoribosylamino)methylideneamino]imidazole-4-carboxamide isomerase [Clostridiales bacterium]|nr:1-(5-phosphoribosyl)-5-[(5-phosphoribosylamino)methylideneamino]imidazole-4-carboxamide isomerase [Clostridiales bacterium]